MTFSIASDLSVDRARAGSPAANAIAPAATIAPCPTIKRGTEATVPMPPGLVSVNVAPVCSSTRSLLSRAFATRSSYAPRNCDEAERRRRS